MMVQGSTKRGNDLLSVLPMLTLYGSSVLCASWFQSCNPQKAFSILRFRLISRTLLYPQFQCFVRNTQIPFMVSDINGLPRAPNPFGYVSTLLVSASHILGNFLWRPSIFISDFTFIFPPKLKANLPLSLTSIPEKTTFPGDGQGDRTRDEFGFET
jgi:hypothetical protein